MKPTLGTASKEMVKESRIENSMQSFVFYTNVDYLPILSLS